MTTTPQSNRLTVAIFGRRNAGKSTLFNAVTGSDIAIVSDTPGTTTDPVVKSMELLPFGPIVLIDTAGLDDDGLLGKARVKKTESILNRTDLAIYVIDALDPALEDYEDFARTLSNRNLPCLPVITKGSNVPASEIEALMRHLPGSIPVCVNHPDEVDGLKSEMSRHLQLLKNRLGRDLIEGLLPAGAVVAMVVPLDSAAPAGRLILPQVQLLRACLDNGIRCHVSTEKDLPQAISELARLDLVVTDSQAFKIVASIVPEHIPLTSFSILLSRQKGNLPLLAEGIKAVSTLKAEDKVLIAETCTHGRTHEDIGRVKIPGLLTRLAGPNIQIDFMTGRDYPDDLRDYALIIHCGGCMISRTEMLNRLRTARTQGVPITNYGVFLAYAGGILERSLALPGLMEDSYESI